MEFRCCCKRGAADEYDHRRLATTVHSGASVFLLQSIATAYRSLRQGLLIIGRRGLRSLALGFGNSIRPALLQDGKKPHRLRRRDARIFSVLVRTAAGVTTSSSETGTFFCLSCRKRVWAISLSSAETGSRGFPA